ncbi:hypothetical protein KY284_005039 [Solanum tuberosum]|nr:hypothetical protein KY284_005039 [Solanum tuberosum]
MESHIEWKIGKGEVSFWYDKWCSWGPIYKHMPVDFTPPDVNLREVLNRRTWNWDIFTFQPTNEIKDKLYSIGITLDENKKDRAIWKLSNSGQISSASTWDKLRQRKEVNNFYGKLWRKEISFKMAFLVWRAVNNKLSTDDRVARMGITLEPKCYCCTTSHARIDLEDVQHLFFEGDFAKSIWRHFAGPQSPAPH